MTGMHTPPMWVGGKEGPAAAGGAEAGVLMRTVPVPQVTGMRALPLQMGDGAGISWGGTGVPRTMHVSPNCRSCWGGPGAYNRACGPMLSQV